MAERLDLAAATGPQTSLWRVQRLVLERGLSSNGGPIALDPSRSVLYGRVIGENGLEAFAQWNGAAAESLLVALNKARLDLISLEKRFFNQAIADGKLSGTVSGSPD